MNEKKLYKSAVESINRYKSEELTDFEIFITEIEKEYGIKSKEEGQK